MSQLREPTAIDVFCGCGGVTHGLQAAGFRVLAGIELNQAGRAAFRANHPSVRRLYFDVRKVKSSTVMADLGLDVGDLDLLTGCSPCQGFSRMRTRNRRKAANDERNDLVFDFVRLIEGLLPKTILFENVPGLTSDWRFSVMIGRLRKKSYRLSYETINLADYGVPQRRKRLILVGSRLGPLAVSLVKAPHQNVRRAIGHLVKPDESDDPLHRSLSVHCAEVMERIRKTPKNGGSRSDLGPDAQLPCHQRIDGYRDVYGRMHWDKPSPTITRYCTNPSKGRYLHPEQDREITLREASLLQTFPPDYQFPHARYGRGAVASMIGEALPPVFAEKLGALINEHLLAMTPHT